MKVKGFKLWLPAVLGCIFVCCLISGCSSADSGVTAEKIKSLEEKIAEVERQATRAQDVIDIMNLQARYEAIHTTQEELVWHLYAPREDSVDEVTHSRIVGYEYIKMQFTDRDKLNQLYREGKLPEGTHIHQMDFGAGGPPADGEAPPMGAGGPPTAGGIPIKTPENQQVFGSGPTSVPPIHPIATYNIVVADDGQTAKATFTSFGFERGGWCYGKYANDYIKIDGTWYIWHKKWLRGFSASYYKSPDENTIDTIFEWTTEKDENGFPVVNENLTTSYLWYPGKENMTITAPKPYKTWTEEEEDWWKRETVMP
jgi:hypothetical protein